MGWCPTWGSEPSIPAFKKRRRGSTLKSPTVKKKVKQCRAWSWLPYPSWCAEKERHTKALGGDSLSTAGVEFCKHRPCRASFFGPCSQGCHSWTNFSFIWSLSASLIPFYDALLCSWEKQGRRQMRGKWESGWNTQFGVKLWRLSLLSSHAALTWW